MSLISAKSITHAFGAEEVLSNASLRLADDSRVGLVGPNGEGKTTLLRILAGQLAPTAGTVHRRRDLRIGYLPQDPPAAEAATLHQAMLEVFSDLLRMEEEMEALAARLAEDASLLDRYGRLQSEFDVLGGYDYSHRIEAVLTGLSFAPETWDRPLSQFSGGERTRAHLGRLLLEKPELLLLDEPTNHLDLESVEWLERWLAAFGGALVVVSHDRYFLDHTTDNTWEVAFGSLEAYRGCYSNYLAKRQARYEERLQQWQSQQEYIASTQEFVRRHLAGQRTKEAQGRRTRLERFMKTRAIAKPRTAGQIHVSFSTLQRSGDLVLEATDLSVGFVPDEPLLAAGQLRVQRGDRIAIVGANGIGKTTLLRTLLGQMPALDGTIRLGANVQPGYLSQMHEELHPEMTALETLQQGESPMRTDEARSLLGGLLLRGDDVFKRIGELSGGQRSRILLARLVARKANVLVLDEPTNHLDIPSQEVLQNVLAEYTGTVIFVSHDRYLIDALATDIWAIDGKEITALPGRWDDYVRWRTERRNAPAGPSAELKKSNSAAASKKDAYRLRRREQNRTQRMRRRLEEVEQLVGRSEESLAQLHEEISQAGEAGEMDRIEELGRQYQRRDAELKALLSEWESLSEDLETVEDA